MISSKNITAIDQTAERLGLQGVRPDLDGLTRLYKAWCLNVPFDNLRKVMALRTDQELPGASSEDFLDNWLQHGTGGTCWPSSNGLYVLVKGLGFDASRATGAMLDMGLNHGTVIVKLDGAEWLVDSSLLTMVPLPLLPGAAFAADHPLYRAEVDPEGDTFFIWATSPPFESMLAFRLLERNVDESLYRERYEWSRGFSPFNKKVHARRNFEHRLLTLHGDVLVELTTEGQTVKKLSLDDLAQTLVGRYGYSQSIVDRLAACGALEASVAPEEPMEFPKLDRVPPSQRTSHK